MKMYKYEKAQGIYLVWFLCFISFGGLFSVKTIFVEQH